MPGFIEFITDLGNSSLGAFWFPLLLWSVLSVAVWTALALFKKWNTLMQYHIRIALMAAIPGGLAASTLITMLCNECSLLAEKLQLAMISIPNPFVMETDAVTINPASSLSWIDLNHWLGIVTLVITVISLFRLLRLFKSYNQLHQFVKNTKTYFLSEIDGIQSNFNLFTTGNITVAFSELVQAPFTYGWKSPVIILPLYLKNSSKTMLHAILYHEIVHIRRADFILNTVTQAMKSVFWFHPLIHLYGKEAEFYREIACDAEVLSHSPVSEKQYAHILYQMNSSSEPSQITTVDLTSRASLLKKRFEFIISSNSPQTRSSFSKSAVVSLSILLITAGLLGCTELKNSLNKNKHHTKIDTHSMLIYVLDDKERLVVNDQIFTIAEFTKFLQQTPASQIGPVTIRTNRNTSVGKVTDIKDLILANAPAGINYNDGNLDN